MSEERKKDLRTQGRFSDVKKSRDKRQKSSSSAVEPLEKRTNKRYSNESKNSSNSFVDEDISPIKYERSSDYHFNQLECPVKQIEIREPGRVVLSTTENGESVVRYEPEFLEKEEADFYYDRFIGSINWSSKNIVINGEEKRQPRLVCWFGPYPYSYSGTTLEPAEMPDSILEIKRKVEDYLKGKGSDTTFNSVLLNLYRDGRDSVAWHSDDESTMGICPTIASISLGETRRFEMKPKRKYSDDDETRRKDEYYVHLIHGSLIIMDGCMQEDWQHRVPKEYHDRDPRINLTFRTVYPLEETSHTPPIKENKVHSRVSNKTSTYKINDEFQTLNHEEFPPLNQEEFPPLNHDDFQQLNNDINPSPTFSNIAVRSENFNSSSNFLKNDLNKSSEYWDSEISFPENVKVENDNTGPSYDSFAADDTEACVETNDNSFKMNSVESQFGHSVSPSNVTRECNHNKVPSKTCLNVSAKEFVPKNSLLCQNTDYGNFSLEELLHFQVELMDREKINDFALHLKEKVSERLHEFDRHTREELEFLCALTDGTQTEENQKLISVRVIEKVMINLPRRHHLSPNVHKSYDRHPRSNNYGNSNHSERGRRFYQHPPRMSNTRRHHL